MKVAAQQKDIVTKSYEILAGRFGLAGGIVAQEIGPRLSDDEKVRSIVSVLQSQDVLKLTRAEHTALLVFGISPI